MLDLITELFKREWPFEVYNLGNRYGVSVILGDMEYFVTTEEQAIKLLDEIQTFW